MCWYNDQSLCSTSCLVTTISEDLRAPYEPLKIESLLTYAKKSGLLDQDHIS